MSDSTPEIRKSDKYIPYYFVLFFIVVAIVDGIFVTVALETHTGVVTEHAYEEGLSYNDVLEASDAQDALGWTNTLTFDEETNILTFAILDEKGNTIENASVKATIERPIQDGFKFEITLHSDDQYHVYRVPVSFPVHGEWDVRIYASKDGQHYQTSKRFVVGY